MRYILLIYGDEKMRATMSEQEGGALFKQYGEFTEASGRAVPSGPATRCSRPAPPRPCG